MFGSACDGNGGWRKPRGLTTQLFAAWSRSVTCIDAGSDFSRDCLAERCATRLCIELLQRRDASGRCRGHRN